MWRLRSPPKSMGDLPSVNQLEAREAGPDVEPGAHGAPSEETHPQAARAQPREAEEARAQDAWAPASRARRAGPRRARPVPRSRALGRLERRVRRGLDRERARRGGRLGRART